jgi:quercetin dioxygenase-like cupin family protein
MGRRQAAVSGARRVVTGHDGEGRSVVVQDGPAPAHALPGAVFHELWSTPAAPAPIAARARRAPRALVVPPEPNGTLVRIVDLEPASRSPMHRTETVDYGIVLVGEVTLVLDDGSETLLHAGDVVVQRGTDHAWVNATDQWARMAFVLVDGRFTDELRASIGDAALFDEPLAG